MITAIKREKTEKIIPCEKSTYMEVLGSNRVIYRVTSSKIIRFGKEELTYGVEAETKIGPVKFKEAIDDFSDDVKSAVGFTELMVRNNIKPALIYNAALCYLRKNL